MKLTLLTLMAMQYLNTPYKWGGNNSDGLDCSGLVLKALSDVGLLLPDMTANRLMSYCEKNGVLENEKLCDTILFFGKNGKASHVAISLGVIDGEWYMIEAGGAGRDSKEMSREELAQRDARVRIKPVRNRRDLIASIKIPYKELSE